MLPVVPPVPSCSVPAEIVVPPEWPLSACSVSVPAPPLVRVSLPPMALVTPRLTPAAALMPPPPAPSVMARAVSKLAVAVSVPPASDSAPAATPRFSSRETCSVPPLTAVPPV